MNNINLTLEQFKQRSAKTSRYLKDKGFDIPKSTLSQSLSLMFGEKNWNTLQAKLKKESAKTNKNISDESITTTTEKEIKAFYLKIFKPYFSIIDYDLFNIEIKKIAQLMENKFILSEYFHKLCISNPSFPNNFDLLGDEDVIKFSFNSKLDKKQESDFFTKILLLITTPGMLTSTEINNCLSRNPIYHSRNNTLKHSNYVYIFFDEDTLINNRIIREKNYSLSTITQQAKFNIIKEEDKEENVKCSLFESSDVLIKDKTINLNSPLPEIIAFFK
jgi:hypothetical protein